MEAQSSIATSATQSPRAHLPPALRPRSTTGPHGARHVRRTSGPPIAPTVRTISQGRHSHNSAKIALFTATTPASAPAVSVVDAWTGHKPSNTRALTLLSMPCSIECRLHGSNQAVLPLRHLRGKCCRGLGGGGVSERSPGKWADAWVFHLPSPAGRRLWRLQQCPLQ